MTRDELDLALDGMANNEPDQQPGVITVEADHWCAHLSQVRASSASLADGMRYRNIKILVFSAFETAVVTRAEACGRGEPYRDLTPRPKTA
ncbi:hypothetical protein [Brevundimonas vesicularis]|uniref:hypothetical protein n=1 Tax=Brevundimonas vesicularis TaxID=41276 RepID=UPI00384F1F65